MTTTAALWWQSGIIYQIYPRSFKDNSGDGTGDLAGIIDKLDYLSDTLGIDAIWLSPFYPSPGADFGYDVSNHTEVDPLFGDLATFDRLVAEAHRRDLKVIIDFVPNHTSDQHPWFLESRSSRDNPKRNWYFWADAKPDGGLPNNWLSVFGGPAWEWDAATGQYYLHTFLKEQPDLNWRNPEVKPAMFDIARFWLDRGVDGFRLDVAHHIMKDPELRDDPPNPAIRDTGYKPMGGWDTLLHVNSIGHPDAHAVMRDLRRLLDQYSAERPRFSVGEIHISDMRRWATYYWEQLDELHMPFNFALLNAPWTAQGVRAAVEGIEAAVPAGGWPNYVLGNHDESRVATRVGADMARLAMLLLLTLRGTPTLYYGDEIGMQDVEIPPEQEQDPFGKRVPGLGLGRDPERTPMQWDGTPNAGFCPAGVTPWLPIADDYRACNVASQLNEPGSMLSLTRQIIRLRRENPALALGSYQTLRDGVPESCYAYLRRLEAVGKPAQRMLVALNYSDQPQTLSLPDIGRGTIAVSTRLDRQDEVVNLSSLQLRAGEGCLIRLE